MWRLGANSVRSSWRQRWMPMRHSRLATALDSCSRLGQRRAREEASSVSEAFSVGIRRFLFGEGREASLREDVGVSGVDIGVVVVLVRLDFFVGVDGCGL